MSDVEVGGPKYAELDGYLVGPERVARNRARTEQLEAAGTRARGGGNIHDDDTAQKLGFRGGTVAGSIDLDQFPPVLTAAFGGRWFERGSVSLQFRNATVDTEAVIAMVGVPGPGATQVVARMERADGMAVADGTAGCAETEPPYLHAIDLRPSPPEELRLLAGVEAGQPLTERSFVVASVDQVARLEAAPITEPLDLHDPGPFRAAGRQPLPGRARAAQRASRLRPGGCPGGRTVRGDRDSLRGRPLL